MSIPPPGFRPPRIIAHRGASADYPENTLAAFDAALAQGCDGIELDLQLSRDGVPLVYHDRSLRKIGGGGKAVRQTDWAEIASLDAGGWLDPRHAGQAVPTFDQVLDRYARRTRLLLELKVRPRDKRAGVGVALATAVAQRLQSLRLKRHVMVLCFDIETLELMTDLAAEVPTVLNLKAPRQPTRSFRRHSRPGVGDLHRRADDLRRSGRGRSRRRQAGPDLYLRRTSSRDTRARRRR